jgi:predicted ATPase
MASRRNRTINLPAPYLRRVWLEPSRIADRAAYPFCLPFLQDDFELSFDWPITIIVGENGTGKSTFLEGIAVLAGYDEAGGGKGYMPVDHSNALEKMGEQLSNALRARASHKLKGDRWGQWAMTVNERWPICFEFHKGEAHDLEIVDYHRG